MVLNETYFWTSTILEWKHLLSNDSLMDIIISSLHYLSRKKLVEVYGFVIMPNHIHLLWKLLKMNKKEKPNASFQKFAAHTIQDIIKTYPIINFEKYQVNEYDREYRLWQRDPAAILITCKEMLEHKLKYIHNNPLQEHWSLVNRPEDYKYSSSGYYEEGRKDWYFLIDYRERF